MDEPDAAATLSMREMSARSGVSEGTLRMWETRHDFPVPQRLPSGHRRYSERDLRQVRSVVLARRQGLSLPTAIARARLLLEQPRPSLYAALRETFPHVLPHVLPKPALLRMTRAIEDELCVKADRPLLFGAFQHERFYRQVQRRWRELARTAERAVVLADFARPRKGAVPVEVAIPPAHPLTREWVVVCDAPSFAACLVGLQRPPDGRYGKRFETLWTVERPVVREAARLCGELVGRFASGLEDFRGRLGDPPPPAEQDLRTIIDLATRMVEYAVEE